MQTISFERADENQVRGVVWGLIEGQRRIIAMGQGDTVQEVASFLVLCNPEVSAVELSDGALDDGGELSVVEAAVLAYSHLETA